MAVQLFSPTFNLVRSKESEIVESRKFNLKMGFGVGGGGQF